MLDFLLHVYRKGGTPFRSLSALPTEEALEMMRRLYVEGSVFWERFSDPEGYLGFRRQVERSLREGFLGKGGRPKSEYPIYLVVGRPRWFDTAADARTLQSTSEITVPLAALDSRSISFTYPDSMVSALMARERNPHYYEPDYHGRVFTLAEIEQIVMRNGLPGEGWETRMPRQYAHYIEAQVWDPQALQRYWCGAAGASASGGRHRVWSDRE